MGFRKKSMPGAGERLFARAREGFHGSVWEVSVTDLGRARATWVRFCRVLYMLLRELLSGQIAMRAGSLVFTTLLSLVPMLAVSFSVLKAFGVHNELENWLTTVLAPLGAEGQELTLRIVEFVDNIKVTALGGYGLAVLFITVVMLVLKIEAALNYVWRVEQPRPIRYRLTGYLSVLMVGPLFVFSALGIMASLVGSSTFQDLIAYAPIGGRIINLASKAVPFALITSALTFVYMFIPNRRVSLKAALAGGASAGLLWSIAGWMFADFVTKSPNYTAVYQSFAVMFVFIFWLYVVWMIVLVGAAVSFYVQHPEYRHLAIEAVHPDNRLREQLAIGSMLEIGRHHVEGLRPVSAEGLKAKLGVPMEVLGRTLDVLEAHGLILETYRPQRAYVPARTLDSIAMADVVSAARSQGNLRRTESDEPRLAELFEQVEASVRDAFGDMTLAEIVAASGSGSASASARLDDVGYDREAAGDDGDDGDDGVGRDPSRDAAA